MDKNKKIMIGAIGAAVVAGGVAIGLIVSRTPPKADLSTFHTEASTKAPTETEVKPQETTVSETETTAKTEENAPRLSAVTATYTSGKVSIQYPVIEDMEDTQKQEQINEHLKANALSVLKGYEINEETDSLTVSCEIVSADRKRLTAVYTGSLMVENGAHPTNIFYTNTVNLAQIQDMGLNDFTDAYTMAGYVLSDDVQFPQLNAEETSAALEYRSTQTLEDLTALFKDADFPVSEGENWPESFSYEKQGRVYFSLPVPHALGDYVIVAFDPATK